MLLTKYLINQDTGGGGGDTPLAPLTYEYTGSVQTYTVPSRCYKVGVDAVGGSGYYGIYEGNNFVAKDGAKGGRVTCDLSVTPGQILYICVGGKGSVNSGGMPNYAYGGWNGGGTMAYSSQYGETIFGNGGGGGATDIRTVAPSSGSWYDTSHSSWVTDASLLSRLVVAGGAGSGSGFIFGTYDFTISSGGGGLVGQNGVMTYNGTTYTATGGTQSSGGNTSSNTNYNCPGTFGLGGNNNSVGGLGGGGGGWYGGAGGYVGGGGSGYTHPTLCSNVVHTSNYQQTSGHGYLILTPYRRD